MLGFRRSPRGHHMADEQPFRVTDRRRRDDAAPEAPAPPVQPDLGAPIQPPPAPSPGSPPSPDAPAGGPDLQGLFVMLASSALVNLGEAAEPGTGQRKSLALAGPMTMLKGQVPTGCFPRLNSETTTRAVPGFFPGAPWSRAT